MTLATYENARLEELARLVLPGLPVADVGTDHARLPKRLVERGISPHVIASDRSHAVIARLRIALRDARCAERIELVQADGLDALAGRHAATVVIAGMGGQAIARILRRGPHALEGIRRLVIAPQRDTPLVRRALHALGWRPVEERLAESRGRFYWILAFEAAGAASRTGRGAASGNASRKASGRASAPASGTVGEPLDDVDAALGTIARRRRDEPFLRFAAAERARLTAVLDEMGGARSSRGDARRERLARIRDALDEALRETPCTSVS